MFHSAQSGAPESDGSPVAPATAASWRNAEAQLFEPLALQPDLYRVVVVLVGETVGQLRRLGPSTAALRDAAPTIATVVRDASEQAGVSTGGIDPDLVGRAALALRHREVMAEMATARRTALLAAARAEGLPWVVLEEAGDWTGDPWAPYQRLEAHAATGRALLVTTTIADDLQTCEHSVELLHIDVGSGCVGQLPGPDAGPFHCSTAAEREARVEALRRTLAPST